MVRREYENHFARPFFTKELAVCMSMHTDTTPGKAAILRFPRKRGRPRVNRPHTDTGTPELVMKRLKGETVEALDLCLERGIITPEQHWCGIHLRWLYTLRYGALGIRAVDPTHLGGVETKTDDPEWRAAREKEYHDAIKKLHSGGHVSLLMTLCIFNERPAFLSTSGTLSQKRAVQMTNMISDLQKGLDILRKEWR